MSRRVDRYAGTAAVVLLAAMLGLAALLQIGVWRECRATDSWYYCWRTVF